MENVQLIENDRQYCVSTTWLSRFEEAIKQLELDKNTIPVELYQSQCDAFIGQIEILKYITEEYRTRTGNTDTQIRANAGLIEKGID